MKKLFFVLSVSILFFACSGSPERGNYIPKTAKAVVTINMKGIVDEIKWDILFGGDLLKFKNIGKGAFAKQLMEDPTKAGVEFMERAYVYYDSSAIGADIVIVAIVPLSDGDAFGEFISTKGDTVLSEGDYQFSNSFGAQLVWNNKTAFYVSGQKDGKAAVAYVAKLVEGEKSGLLSTEFKGKTVLTGEDHIAYWVNTSDIQKSLMASPMAAALGQMPTAKSIEKSELTGVVNFKKGQLQASMDQYFDEKSDVMKIFNKQSKLKELAVAADISKSMISMGFTFNMKEAAAYLGKSGGKESIDALLAMAGVNVDALAAMLEGDVFVSFNGLKMQMEEKETVEMNEQTGEYEMGSEMKPAYYPSIVAAVSVGDTAMMQSLVNRMLYNFAAISKDGVYSFGPGKGHLFFSNKNLFYVSDSAAIATIRSGKAIASNDLLGNCTSAFMINVKDVSKKLPLIDISPDADKIAKKIEASIEGIKAVAHPAKAGVSHSEFELNAVNKEENILLTILKLMKELDSPSPEA